MHPFFDLISTDMARERRADEQRAALEAERSADAQQVADARADLAGKLATRIRVAPSIQELALTPEELGQLGDVLAARLEAIFRERGVQAAAG